MLIHHFFYAKHFICATLFLKQQQIYSRHKHNSASFNPLQCYALLSVWAADYTEEKLKHVEAVEPINEEAELKRDW